MSGDFRKCASSGDSSAGMEPALAVLHKEETMQMRYFVGILSSVALLLSAPVRAQSAPPVSPVKSTNLLVEIEGTGSRVKEGGRFLIALVPNRGPAQAGLTVGSPGDRHTYKLTSSVETLDGRPLVLVRLELTRPGNGEGVFDIRAAAIVEPRKPTTLARVEEPGGGGFKVTVQLD